MLMEYLQLNKQKYGHCITDISKFSCFKCYQAIEAS